MGNGLAAAGMVSGFGNNLNQGLQTLNSGIVQWGIQGSLAKNDRDFQLEKMDRQQRFEKELMGQKMAADRQNTLDTIAAQGKNAMDLESARGKTQKEIEGMKEDAAGDRLNKQLGKQETLEMMKLGVTKQIHDEDRKMQESRWKQYFSVEQQKSLKDNNKVSMIPTADGRMLMMTPQGKAMGYVVGPDGQEIKGKADVPQSAMLQANAILDEMHDMSREYAKNPMHTPEDEDAYKARKKDMQQSISALLSGQQPVAPIQKPIVIPPRYQNLTPGSTQPGPVKPAGSPFGMVGDFFNKVGNPMGATK